VHIFSLWEVFVLKWISVFHKNTEASCNVGVHSVTRLLLEQTQLSSGIPWERRERSRATQHNNQLQAVDRSTWCIESRTTQIVPPVLRGIVMLFSVTFCYALQRQGEWYWHRNGRLNILQRFLAVVVNHTTIMLKITRGFRYTYLTTMIMSTGWYYVSELLALTGLLFIPMWYMSMDNHGGMMMSTEDNFLFVHQSSLAILPAVIW
jgi:hypothetical protein